MSDLFVHLWSCTKLPTLASIPRRISFIDRQTLLGLLPPFQNNNNRNTASFSTDDGQWSWSTNTNPLTIQKINLIY